MSNHITLRPVTPDDDAFLLQLYASTRPEIANFGWDDTQQNAFARMQFEMRSRWHSIQWPTAEHSIIMFDNRKAGDLIVSRGDEQISLVAIAVLLKFRGSDIGSTVIRRLQDEAGECSLPLELKVDKTNSAALGLYSKLGFQITGDLGTLVQLRWDRPIQTE